MLVRIYQITTGSPAGKTSEWGYGLANELHIDPSTVSSVSRNLGEFGVGIQAGGFSFSVENLPEGFFSAATVDEPFVVEVQQGETGDTWSTAAANVVYYGVIDHEASTYDHATGITSIKSLTWDAHLNRVESIVPRTIVKTRTTRDFDINRWMNWGTNGQLTSSGTMYMEEVTGLSSIAGAGAVVVAETTRNELPVEYRLYGTSTTSAASGERTWRLSTPNRGGTRLQLDSSDAVSVYFTTQDDDPTWNIPVGASEARGFWLNRAKYSGDPDRLIGASMRIQGDSGAYYIYRIESAKEVSVVQFPLATYRAIKIGVQGIGIELNSDITETGFGGVQRVDIVFPVVIPADTEISVLGAAIYGQSPPNNVRDFDILDGLFSLVSGLSLVVNASTGNYTADGWLDSRLDYPNSPSDALREIQMATRSFISFEPGALNANGVRTVTPTVYRIDELAAAGASGIGVPVAFTETVDYSEDVRVFFRGRRPFDYEGEWETVLGWTGVGDTFFSGGRMGDFLQHVPEGDNVYTIQSNLVLPSGAPGNPDGTTNNDPRLKSFATAFYNYYSQFYRVGTIELEGVYPGLLGTKVSETHTTRTGLVVSEDIDYVNLTTTLTVRIGAWVAPSNQAPVAVLIGPDEAWDFGAGATVTLDASRSYDPNNDDITFVWKKNGTPIPGETGRLLIDQPVVDGDVILVEVSDGALTDTDSVTVTVFDLTANLPDPISIEYRGMYLDAAIDAAASDATNVEVDAVVRKRGVNVAVEWKVTEDGVETATSSSAGAYEYEETAITVARPTDSYAHRAPTKVLHVRGVDTDFNIVTPWITFVIETDKVAGVFGAFVYWQPRTTNLIITSVNADSDTDSAVYNVYADDDDATPIATYDSGPGGGTPNHTFDLEDDPSQEYKVEIVPENADGTPGPAWSTSVRRPTLITSGFKRAFLSSSREAWIMTPGNIRRAGTDYYVDGRTHRRGGTVKLPAAGTYVFNEAEGVKITGATGNVEGIDLTLTLLGGLGNYAWAESAFTLGFLVKTPADATATREFLRLTYTNGEVLSVAFSITSQNVYATYNDGGGASPISIDAARGNDEWTPVFLHFDPATGDFGVGTLGDSKQRLIQATTTTENAPVSVVASQAALCPSAGDVGITYHSIYLWDKVLTRPEMMTAIAEMTGYGRASGALTSVYDPLQVIRADLSTPVYIGDTTSSMLASIPRTTIPVDGVDVAIGTGEVLIVYNPTTYVYTYATTSAPKQETGSPTNITTASFVPSWTIASGAKVYIYTTALEDEIIGRKESYDKNVAQDTTITTNSSNITTLQTAVADLETEAYGFRTTWANWRATSATAGAWDAFTLTREDGTYSIVAGSVGSLTSTITYIYFDPVASTTVLQTTTSASTSRGAGKTLLAIAQSGTVSAKIIPTVGVFNVGRDMIEADAISTNQLAANSVTAAKMSVAQLSAIVADLGTITAGELLLGTGTVGVDFTGLRLYDTGSNVYRFAGIDNNVEKVYITNTGTIVVPSGSGQIHADAITAGTISAARVTIGAASTFDSGYDPATKIPDQANAVDSSNLNMGDDYVAANSYQLKIGDTGTIGSTFTGFVFSRDSGVGKFEAWNLTDKTFYIDTDGRAYAGAGNVRVDEDGITLKEASAYLAKNALTFENTAGTFVQAYMFYESTSSLLQVDSAGGMKIVVNNDFEVTGEIGTGIILRAGTGDYVQVPNSNFKLGGFAFPATAPSATNNILRASSATASSWVSETSLRPGGLDMSSMGTATPSSVDYLYFDDGVGGKHDKVTVRDVFNSLATATLVAGDSLIVFDATDSHAKKMSASGLILNSSGYTASTQTQSDGYITVTLNGVTYEILANAV